MRMAGEGEERAVASKLNLVDLAGSERTKKTGVTGQALKVSLSHTINQSINHIYSPWGQQGANRLSLSTQCIPTCSAAVTQMTLQCVLCKKVLNSKSTKVLAQTECGMT